MGRFYCTALLVVFGIAYLLFPIAITPIVAGNIVIGYAALSLVVQYNFIFLPVGEIVIVSNFSYWLSHTLFMIPFALVFSVEVINNINGKTSRRRVRRVGIISMVFPGLFLTFLYIVTMFLTTGVIGIAGPIPVQFIFGMYIVSRCDPTIEKWSDPD